MASTALEEKIEKIRLQNEKIRQRYEEVEADKKNAAKANALVQLVPSDDWPERREPPEFSAPKNFQKPKPLSKEYDRSDRNNERPQHYSGASERFGKKNHKFSEGGGPPPDPKYNFLADSERETHLTDESRGDEDKNRNRNKTPRGASRRRGGGERMNTGGGASHKEAFFKDNRGPNAFYCKDDPLPEYEAWRAERNRIDEARINRQKTAEGNWRREWDNNKVPVEKDFLKQGEFGRKDSSNFERRNNHYDNDYYNRGHGGTRTYHGSQRNHGHQDYRRPAQEQQYDFKRQSSTEYKQPISPTDDRNINIFDKNIQVSGNYGNQAKGPLMSVKVNSPSIAGTGRVGPRQKSRVTYSNQSDVDFNSHEMNSFSRQKSFDEKTSTTNLNSGQRSAPKSYFGQRKKESFSKSPYSQRKEFKNDNSITSSKNPKTSHANRNEFKDQKQSNHSQKPQRAQKRIQKSSESSINNASEPEDTIYTDYNSENTSNCDNFNEPKKDIELSNIPSVDSTECYSQNEITSTNLENIQDRIVVSENNTTEEGFTNEFPNISGENFNDRDSLNKIDSTESENIEVGFIAAQFNDKTEDDADKSGITEEINENKQKLCDLKDLTEPENYQKVSDITTNNLNDCDVRNQTVMSDVENSIATNTNNQNEDKLNEGTIQSEIENIKHEISSCADLDKSKSDENKSNFIDSDEAKLREMLESIVLKDPENIEDYAIVARPYMGEEDLFINEVVLDNSDSSVIEDELFSKNEEDNDSIINEEEKIKRLTENKDLAMLDENIEIVKSDSTENVKSNSLEESGLNMAQKDEIIDSQKLSEELKINEEIEICESKNDIENETINNLEESSCEIPQIMVPDNIEKNIMIEDIENNDGVYEQKKKFDQAEVNLEIKLKTNEKVNYEKVSCEKILDSHTSENDTTDDSGFVDANEFFETDQPKINDVQTSENESINNFNIQKNEIEVSTQELNLDTHTKNSQVESDLSNIAKEKNSDVCDNISAALDVAIKTDEKITEKEENEKHEKKKLEISTKDKEITVIDDDHEKVVVSQDISNIITETENTTEPVLTEVVEKSK